MVAQLWFSIFSEEKTCSKHNHVASGETPYLVASLMFSTAVMTQFQHTRIYAHAVMHTDPFNMRKLQLLV